MDAARAIETFCDVTKGTDVTRCAQIAKSIEEDFALETEKYITLKKYLIKNSLSN